MLSKFGVDVEYNKPNIRLRIVLSVLFLIFVYHKFIYFDNTTLKNVDMEPFSEPQQEMIENGKSFEHKVKDGTAIITPIANYKIYGRVYDRHYRPYKLALASMYPYDVSIGFGDFKHREVYNSINVKMAGTTAYASYSGRAWRNHISKYFKTDSLEHCFTNNHLCPANSKVRRGISRLRKKDVVYIEGYLIKFQLVRKNGNYEKGISSTTRNNNEGTWGNNGNGSCEQIYVTRIVTRHGDYK